MGKLPISQYCRILQNIPRSVCGGGWLPKFNHFFLIERCSSGKFSWKSDQQLSRKVANRQTNKQKERETDKCRVKHNLVGGGNSDRPVVPVAIRIHVRWPSTSSYGQYRVTLISRSAPLKSLMFVSSRSVVPNAKKVEARFWPDISSFKLPAASAGLSSWRALCQTQMGAPVLCHSLPYP